MPRRPTTNELCVFASWIGLLATAFFVQVSTRLWLTFLWATFGNRDWPLLTDIYLSSRYWFWVIPMLAATVITILWTSNRLDRTSNLIQLLLHFASLAILFFTIVAALLPLLSQRSPL